MSPQDSLQLAWLTNRFVARRKDRISEYEGRLARIDKNLLVDWQSAQAKLGVQQRLTHVFLGILFLDPLWRGSAWKSGNPQEALRRMNALPKEWVLVKVEELALRPSPLQYITKDDPTDFSFDESFKLPNMCAAIDGLFAGGAFDSELFDQAYLIFKKSR